LAGAAIAEIESRAPGRFSSGRIIWSVVELRIRHSTTHLHHPESKRPAVRLLRQRKLDVEELKRGCAR
jgi:hypothetical protein